MMVVTGKLGTLGMGCMYSTIKVREGFARGDYVYPKSTLANKWNGEAINPVRAPTSRGGEFDVATCGVTDIQDEAPSGGKSSALKEATGTVKKPGGHGGYSR